VRCASNCMVNAQNVKQKKFLQDYFPTRKTNFNIVSSEDIIALKVVLQYPVLSVSMCAHTDESAD
jgi:hypothetical protein